MSTELKPGETDKLWTISNIIAGSTELVTTACKHNS